MHPRRKVKWQPILFSTNCWFGEHPVVECHTCFLDSRMVKKDLRRRGLKVFRTNSQAPAKRYSSAIWRQEILECCGNRFALCARCPCSDYRKLRGPITITDRTVRPRN